MGGSLLEGFLKRTREDSTSWELLWSWKWIRQCRERMKELASDRSLKGLGFTAGQKLSPLDRTERSASDRSWDERLRTEWSGGVGFWVEGWTWKWEGRTWRSGKIGVDGDGLGSLKRSDREGADPTRGPVGPLTVLVLAG